MRTLEIVGFPDRICRKERIGDKCVGGGKRRGGGRYVEGEGTRRGRGRGGGGRASKRLERTKDIHTMLVCWSVAILRDFSRYFNLLLEKLTH